jgi:hypothetical protein
MKHIVVILTALFLSAPAQAEEQTMENLLKQFEELSNNAQTLLEGWVEELGPKLEELGPTLEGLVDKIDGMSAYHPPEVLENGDIIIRRKVPLRDEPKGEPKAKEPPDESTIEL